MRQRFDYCLFCYAKLDGAPDCPACGRAHDVLHARTFWSREPRLRRFEEALKGLLVTLLVLAFVWLAMQVGSETGDPRVATFLVGPVLIVGGALYWTAGLITRRPSYISPRLVWGLVIGLFVFAGPLLLVLLDFLAKRDISGGEYWGKFADIFVRGLPALGIGAALLLASRGLAAYKRRVLPDAQREVSGGGG